MLANRAQWDESAEIRATALARISDASALASIVSGGADVAVREAARERLGLLQKEGSPPPRE